MPDFPYSSTSSSRPQLHYLTGLRFLAALCIFLLHASDHGFVSHQLSTYFDFSKSVSFFFVLSGFVLSYAYHSKKLILPIFYLDRISRVWPITFISLIFTVLFLPSNLYLPFPQSSSSPALVLFSNILCLQSLIPIPSFYFGYNAVAWSISTEIFFYFLFPYLNRLNCKKILLLLVGNILIVSTISYFLSFTAVPFFSQNYLDSLSLHGIAYIHPFFRLPEFIFGILAYKLSLALLNSRVPINILFKCILRFLKYPIFVDILCFSFIYFCFPAPLDFAPASVQITLVKLNLALVFLYLYA